VPGDAIVAAVSGLYVAASISLGRTINPNVFAWPLGRVILRRRGDAGIFWLWVVMAALWFVGSFYATVRLLFFGRYP
jgi:hypothetical protein